MVGCNLRWHSRRISRLSFEFVLLPARRCCKYLIVSAFHHHLESLPRNPSESAVSTYQMKRVVARVHHLPGREHVSYRLDTESNDEQGERNNGRPVAN